ncbi:MAG: NERD domain-containing protein [Dehalococcoidales bacterium]|nr:NERD domain-containing protein [Dehalococcoidales bacterium]
MFESVIKGTIGEFKTKLTQNLLLDHKKYHIFNNVIIPVNKEKTQIDHIIVSKNGIFVIETKKRTGWIFGTEKESQWTVTYYNNYKVRFPNPLHQNYKHTMSLAEHLGVDHSKIHSLIVFWGECEFKTKMPPNVVKGISEFLRFITSKKEYLITDEETDSICQKLKIIKDNTSFFDGINHAIELKNKYDSIYFCPRCGGKLVERIATRGKNVGNTFLGCENFPKCRYIKD